MIPFLLLKWVHVVCMVGATGTLMASQWAFRWDERNSAEFCAKISRLVNILVGIGFLAGIAMYGMKHGHLLGGHYNGVIGAKFIILLAVGAFMALSKKTGTGDRWRWISLCLLVLAALLGSSLSL